MPPNPVLLIILGLLAILIINLIIGLVEGVALTLLGWNPFRQSMAVSFIMNIASGVFNGVILVFLQQTPLLWIPLSLFVSILVEVFIVSYFKRNAFGKNLLDVILANLSSYILLVLPAFYFGTHP